MLRSFLCVQKDLENDNGHLLVLVPKRSGTLSKKIVHKVNGTQWRTMMLEFDRKRTSNFPLSMHYATDLETIETVFCAITHVNQLSLCGAIGEICEEYETLHERTGRPVVMGQSSSSLAKCDQDRSTFGLWWPGQPRSSIAAKWSTNWKAVTTRQLSKFCMDARFLNVVEIGCIPDCQETKKHLNRKRWIQGNTKIGPMLEFATEYGVEIRIWSLNRDNTHSSVRISHGSSLWWIWTTMRQKFQKFNSKNMRSNWMRKVLHADQKTTAKPQRREPVGSSSRIVPMDRRNWTDVEPRKHSLSLQMKFRRK